MGWWETDRGDVLGDGPLDILGNFDAVKVWQTRSDIPSEAIDAIEEEYQKEVGRAPMESDIDALLAFHNGDGGHGIIAKLAGPLPPTEP